MTHISTRCCVCRFFFFLLKQIVTNSVLWWHSLRCKFDYFWNVNLTTFGILDSIGPALHFWYSVLQILLFCKCNARCCLKNLLQIWQFDMITYTGFPMLAMDANFRKMTQSCQLLQSWHPSCFLVLHFWYKTNFGNNVVFGTVMNIWYLTIDLFRWSYNMYCVYIHSVLNQKNWT